MPMIHFTTISTSQGFVDKHPDIVDRFLEDDRRHRLFQDEAQGDAQDLRSATPPKE